MNGVAQLEQERLGLVPPGMVQEPAPYCAAALEALEIWELMGNDLLIERLPVVLALHPECDPYMVIPLLQDIKAALGKRNEA